MRVLVAQQQFPSTSRLVSFLQKRVPFFWRQAFQLQIVLLFRPLDRSQETVASQGHLRGAAGDPDLFEQPLLQVWEGVVGEGWLAPARLVAIEQLAEPVLCFLFVWV